MPALAAALVALALVAAGCGDDEGDETVTVTETGGGDSTSVEATTDATVAETDATGPIDRPPPDKGKTGPKYFQTPSGNIGCYVSPDAARCDIRNRDWEPPPGDPVEKRCELDYGQGIVVGQDHAEFVCAGDTSLGGPKTLAYGQTSQRGRFVCESEPDGITCSQLDNGHGFFLSKQTYRIF
jgi:hypothetical protein